MTVKLLIEELGSGMSKGLVVPSCLSYCNAKAKARSISEMGA